MDSMAGGWLTLVPPMPSQMLLSITGKQVRLLALHFCHFHVKFRIATASPDLKVKLLWALTALQMLEM